MSLFITIFKYFASVYFFVKHILPFCRYIFNYWRGILKPKDLRKYGKWAVVTGGSDGIGKGYVLELAKRGLNVCVISRTELKLKSVCQEVSDKYGTKAEYLVFDFVDGDYQDLYKKLSSFPWFDDIGVLINNVGFLAYGYDCYEKFGAKTLEDVSKLESMNLKSQKINIHAACMMTGFILPVFYKKKKGVIVNLSSLSGVTPTPYWTVYGSAKAFNYYFSESIRKELNYDFPNIICQVVQPAIVVTSMAPKFCKPSLHSPSPETFCKFAVSTIGFVDVTAGYWVHDWTHLKVHYLLPYYWNNLMRKTWMKVQAGRERRRLKQNKQNQTKQE